MLTISCYLKKAPKTGSKGVQKSFYFILSVFFKFQFLNEDDHDAKKAKEIQTLEETLIKQTEVTLINTKFEEKKKLSEKTTPTN